MDKYLVISMNKLITPSCVESLASLEDAELYAGIMSRKNPNRTYRVAIVQDDECPSMPEP